MIDDFKRLSGMKKAAVVILALAAVLNALEYDSAYTGLMTVKFLVATVGLLVVAVMIVQGAAQAAVAAWIVAAAAGIGFISNDTIWEINHGLELGFESFSADAGGISGFKLNFVYAIAALLATLDT